MRARNTVNKLYQQEPEYQTNKHKLVTHNLGDISKVRASKHVLVLLPYLYHQDYELLIYVCLVSSTRCSARQTRPTGTTIRKHLPVTGSIRPAVFNRSHSYTYSH